MVVENGEKLKKVEIIEGVRAGLIEDTEQDCVIILQSFFCSKKILGKVKH